MWWATSAARGQRALTPLLLGKLARYRSVQADVAAAAMLAAASRDLPAGAFESEQIRALASR